MSNATPEPVYRYEQTCLYYKNKKKMHKGHGSSKLDGTLVYAYYKTHDPGLLKLVVRITSEEGESVHKHEERVNRSDAGGEGEGEGPIGVFWVERFGGKGTGSLPGGGGENKQTVGNVKKGGLPVQKKLIQKKAPPQAKRPIVSSSSNFKSVKRLVTKKVGGLQSKTNASQPFRQVKQPSTTANSTPAVPPPPPKTHVPLSSKLSQSLRPHQIEGLEFMHSRVNGNSPLGSSHTGVILADEMGLGKTIQSISLIYSMFMVNRTRKFIVVTPASLCVNWIKEFDKWLGKASQPKRNLCTKAASISKKAKDALLPVDVIKAFVGKTGQSEVLVISYEQFRNNADLMAKTPNLALLLCDEGHRLKGSNNATVSALKGTSALAKVVVTGTPIQNDLKELYNIVEFVNPSLLGDERAFSERYHAPITKANTKGSTPSERELSKQRYSELIAIVNKMMIRRTNDSIAASLPPLHEFCAFVKCGKTQASLYEKIAVKAFSGDREPLPALMDLRKVSGHASLVDDSIPINFEGGSKLEAIISLMKSIQTKAPGDKVVVISNFTVVLDVLAALLPNSMASVRIDGSTKKEKRQPIVDMFNRTPATTHFCFLLSAKAGGAGLNLIGANRLIMVDADWNPAIDAQAMARTHREGQKKICFIYRFFTSGTLEEVILQRQLLKGNLSKNVVDDAGNKNKGVGSKLSRDELKDCFTLKLDTACDTNDKLEGDWGKGGKEAWAGKVDDVALEHFLGVEKDSVTFVKYGRNRDVINSRLSLESDRDHDDGWNEVEDLEGDDENVGFYDNMLSDDDDESDTVPAPKSTKKRGFTKVSQVVKRRKASEESDEEESEFERSDESDDEEVEFEDSD